MAVHLKRYLLAVFLGALALATLLPTEAIAQTQGKRISVSFKDKPLAACALVIVDGSPITVSGAMAEVTAFFFGRSRPEPS